MAGKRVLTAEHRANMSRSMTKERRAKISAFHKGKIPYNKGVYGEKRKRFENGLPVTCINHGEHSNWYYNKKHSQLSCRFCLNERTKKFLYNNLFNKWIFSTKRKNKNKLTVKILAELYLRQGGMCALSGLPLHENVMSLDRIDSSKGYSKNNIQWLHLMVNRMKSNFVQSEFIDMCKLIANNYNKDRSGEIRKIIEEAEKEYNKN